VAFHSQTLVKHDVSGLHPCGSFPAGGTILVLYAVPIGSLLTRDANESVSHHARLPALIVAPAFGQIMTCPPFTASVAPVMKPASSEARNVTQRATSSGSPSRPVGMSGRIDLSTTSFGTAWTISVLM
jgi:hypothetical protein